jgi:hypothetical protein
MEKRPEAPDDAPSEEAGPDEEEHGVLGDLDDDLGDAGADDDDDIPPA